jgi:hypothetical protein
VRRRRGAAERNPVPAQNPRHPTVVGRRRAAIVCPPRLCRRVYGIRLGLRAEVQDLAVEHRGAGPIAWCQRAEALCMANSKIRKHSLRVLRLLRLCGARTSRPLSASAGNSRPARRSRSRDSHAVLKLATNSPAGEPNTNALGPRVARRLRIGARRPCASNGIAAVLRILRVTAGNRYLVPFPVDVPVLNPAASRLDGNMSRRRGLR